jgi:hypothetical protein
MRIWIDTNGGLSVNFQPDSKEEAKMLDKALGFEHSAQEFEISNYRGAKTSEGAPAVAVLGGHETQRWIKINLNKVLAEANNALNKAKTKLLANHIYD